MVISVFINKKLMLGLGFLAQYARVSMEGFTSFASPIRQVSEARLLRNMDALRSLRLNGRLVAQKCSLSPSTVLLGMFVLVLKIASADDLTNTPPQQSANGPSVVTNIQSEDTERASLGSTKGQCNRRYGLPTKVEGNALGEVDTYHHNDLTIKATFAGLPQVSVALEVWNSDNSPLSDDEVSSFLQATTLGGTWSNQQPQPNVWLRSDGAVAIYDPSKAHLLFLSKKVWNSLNKQYDQRSSGL